MKKRRIIFRVFPFNRLTFPLLLNVWEKEGIDEHFEIVIAEEPPEVRDNDVILFSFMTAHLPFISGEMEKIRGKNVLTACGGPHVSGDTVLPREMGFDVLFRGRGEGSFRQFGLDLLNDRIPSGGAVYEDPGIPDPDSYLPVSKYFKMVPPVEIIRGCAWNCRYCQTGTSGHSFRSLSSIGSYLFVLKARGFNRVTFISSSAMEYGAAVPGEPDNGRIKELIETVSSFHFKFFEYGIFPSEIRPGTLDTGTAMALKKHVTNNRITLGAQSGSDRRLIELNRGHGIRAVEESVAIANSAGFAVNLDLIMAFPDETEDERRETLEFIMKLSKDYKVKIHLHHFFPLPGSGYAFRFPSRLGPDEKEYLRKLKRSGISTGWWETHERSVTDYFEWLRKFSPGYYNKYA